MNISYRLVMIVIGVIIAIVSQSVTIYPTVANIIMTHLITGVGIALVVYAVFRIKNR